LSDGVAVTLPSGVVLYLIRHGETDWNRESRYQGQRDIALNDTGRAQARRHGAVLKSLVPSIATYAFVASPLGRAAETMRLLRAELGFAPDDFATEPDLIELSYGDWEGKLASELPASDPDSVAGKVADPFGWRPRGGESYADLETRISGWLRTLDRNTVAVSHGGVSRVARGALLGLERRTVPFLEVPQDRLLKLADGDMEWL
jgi:broad specificity phosphatase PhoE